MYDGMVSSSCHHCRVGNEHTREQHTAQCVARALPVGESAIIGDWVISHRRFGHFDLTAYPVKPGGRTRFGGLADIQEDLAQIDLTGGLPAFVRGNA